MAKLYITRGLPGSGKTSLAESWSASDKRMHISRDGLRQAMFNHRKGYGQLDHCREEQVTVAQEAIVRAMLARGVDVMVDDMNLRARYVKRWYEIARSEGHDFSIITMDTPVDECVRRDEEDRPAADAVGEYVIRKLAGKFYKDGLPKPVALGEDAIGAPAPVKNDPHGPNRIVLCDIDGTVALNTSGRSWYDTERVAEDGVNEPVVSLLIRAGLPVVYMSGRDEAAREVTEAWLLQNKLPSGPLYMRAHGDTRQDAIVKRELFAAHIEGKHNVAFVLDDRNQVVRMWRKIGLPCFQVADGDF